MRLTYGCACFALSCALIGQGANAQDSATPDDAPELPAVQVQGDVLGQSRGGDVRNYAGSRQVISRKGLENGGYRGADDALQHVPGVKIFDETGTGVLPQIMLRGLYESRSGRVQVLQDGIPLSLAPYGQTALSLFPATGNQVDRIDIVRGGAAVQYGPNNVGGVINLVSKPIPDHWTTTLGEKLTAGGAGHFLHDSYLAGGGYLTDNFGLAVDADWVKGQYWRRHSGTDVKNLRLRAEWWLDDSRLIKGEISRYLANMDLAGALSPDDYRQHPRQATRPLDSFSGRTTRGSLTYQQDLGSWGPFDRSQFLWNNFAADSTRNFVIGLRSDPNETYRPDLPPQLRQSAPRGFHVYGSEPRLALHMQSGGVSQQWTFGLRAVSEDIDFLVGNTALDNGTYTLARNWTFKDRAWAAYISDAIGLFGDRLVVTPGVRYEHLNSRYSDRVSGAGTENDIRNALPGLTLGYKAGDRWYLYADAQRSLRAPQVTQIVYGDNLNSELAWNYELGARYFPNPQLTLNADLYWIDFDNQILLDNATHSYGNLGKTRRQGLETQIQWSSAALPGLRLDLGYAYLDASQRSGQYAGKRVPYSSRNQISLGGTYSAGNNTLALNSYYFSRAYSDAANSRHEDAIASVGELPSYWVWNAQASRILLHQDGKQLKGTVAINNMFNRRYWFSGIDTSPWGRQPAPARTLTAGLELRF